MLPSGAAGAPGATGVPGAGVPLGAPGGGKLCAPGGGKLCAPGTFWASSAGATAVGGSWLPPDISAVFASGAAGGRGAGPSCSLNGGANTVAGNGTERSSPASAFVSVPAHGVAPAGTSGAPGTPGAPGTLAATGPLGAPGTRDALGTWGAFDAPGTPGAPDAAAAAPGTAGTPACVSASAPPAAKPPPAALPPTPAPAPDPVAAGTAAPESAPDRRSGRPSLSAASCNHSGGLSRNDV